MLGKFVYVFSEEDKNVLLNHGYTLLREPTIKKPKKNTKGKFAETKDAVDCQDEWAEAIIGSKYWVFENKTSKDLVFESLGKYAFSDSLTF